MYILGIETSCDETSAAVVKNGRGVLSNVVATSLAFHRKYGGVVPEIAFRKQLETISHVTDSALKESGLDFKHIYAISVTNSPGLTGSLLVGISFAQALSYGLSKPLLGIDHLHSHIYANFLTQPGIRFPFIALIVSGGHTSLFRVDDFTRIELLGSTQDDACGEAFDKVAKILGLGYPGGPAIEKAAEKGKTGKIKFNCSATKHALNFSFSGIKTAVLYYVQRRACSVERAACSAKRITHNARRTTQTADICASFQEAVIDTLIKKSLYACELKKIKRLVIGGGVAANNRLREKFHTACADAGIAVYFPARQLCMDNAAMVAGLGYQLLMVKKV